MSFFFFLLLERFAQRCDGVDRWGVEAMEGVEVGGGWMEGKGVDVGRSG